MSCQNPYRDHVRLSSLVNKQVGLHLAYFTQLPCPAPAMPLTRFVTLLDSLGFWRKIPIVRDFLLLLCVMVPHPKGSLHDLKGSHQVSKSAPIWTGWGGETDRQRDIATLTQLAKQESKKYNYCKAHKTVLIPPLTIDPQIRPPLVPFVRYQGGNTKKEQIKKPLK